MRMPIGFFPWERRQDAHRARVKELEIELKGFGALEIQAKLTTGD